jgi:hypothetical protein
MTANKYDLIKPSLFLGFTLVIIGLVGVIYLVFFTLPTLGMRWLFFFFLVLSTSGFALLPISYLHLRFPEEPPANQDIALRQSIWVGIYIGLIAWMQLGKVLDTTRAIFLAIGFIVIEFLLRLRERSQFSPDEKSGK